LPDSFKLAYKSTDPSTHKRTYHVSLTLRGRSDSTPIKDLQTFDEDAEASTDFYLAVSKVLPEWPLPAGYDHPPVLSVYIRPDGNPEHHNQLEVGMSLLDALGADWDDGAYGRSYRRRPTLPAGAVEAVEAGIENLNKLPHEVPHI